MSATRQHEPLLPRSQAHEVEWGVVDFHALPRVKAWQAQRANDEQEMREALVNLGARIEWEWQQRQPTPRQVYGGVPVRQFGRRKRGVDWLRIWTYLACLLVVVTFWYAVWRLFS